MRIVLDTNVVISALIWGGTPYKLIEAAVRGDVDLCTSPALLAELTGVLGRERFVRRLRQRRDAIENVVALFSELALQIVPANVPGIVPNDPSDDEVIAAAVAANATLIVSGDRDLLALGNHGGIRIVTPADAVTLLTPA